MEEERSAGQTVVSYCGKCKIDRLHTIMVMDGETMAKVKCSKCEYVHKVRSAPDPGKGRGPRVSSGPVDEAVAQFVWETCLAEAKGTECSYSKTSKSCVGDIVDHQSFGKGVVLKLYPNRCDMVFKDRKRLMVSAN